MVAATQDQRFERRQLLGKGAFGEVYSTYDHARAELVAVKVLRHINGQSLYRFKQEFRLLQSLQHKGLVKMHELVLQGSEWLLVMELVVGQPFDVFIAGSASPEQTITSERATGDQRDRLLRVEAVLPQLLDALDALHREGLVHRDLKPSNALVASSGRVVLLDFGVVRQSENPDASQDGIIGTPSYMAPEQLLGKPADRRADLYALGVMLYETLAGVRPFVGSLAELCEQKQVGLLASQVERLSALPPRWRELLVALLSADPAARPATDDVRVLLGAPRAIAARAKEALLGRDESLAGIAAAFRSAEALHLEARLVTGMAGMGKTTLLRAAAEQCEEAGAFVLVSRCHPQESVPYSVVDGLVDQLARLLLRHPVEQRESFLPRETAALVKMFPVLEAAVPSRGALSDPLGQRRSAVRALREIFARLSDRACLVCCVDDLQWARDDGLAMLAELFCGGEGLRLLFVGTLQLEDARTAHVVDVIGTWPGLHTQALSLAPLAGVAARKLVTQIMGSEPADVEALLRESQGIPLHLVELTRARLEGAESASFDDLVAQRLDAQTPAAQRLFTVVAACSAPLGITVLSRATGLPLDEAWRAVDALKDVRLLRAAALTDAAPAFSLVHERSRLLAPPADLDLHVRLAHALMLEPVPDCELIATHAELAEDIDTFVTFATKSGEQAQRALAFAHAAWWYDRAAAAGASPSLALLQSAAEAHTFAGHALKAAHAFLRISELAPPELAFDCRRRAAEKLVHHGQVTEGLALMSEVLAQARLRVPSSEVGAIAKLLALSVKRRFRKAGEGAVRADLPDTVTLRRVDTLWSAATALIGIEALRGAVVQAMHLDLAERCGEPVRYARALALSTVSLALRGGRWLEQAEAESARAELIAQRSGDPHAMAWAVAVSGILRWCRGEFASGQDLVTYAISLFGTQPTDSAWEVGVLTVWWRLRTLLWRGKIAGLHGEMAEYLALVRAQGDRFFTALCSHTVRTPLLLVAARPDDAERALNEATALWDRDGFQTPHAEALRAGMNVDLFRGEPEAALARQSAVSQRLAKSYVLEVQNERIQQHELTGRAHVAAAMQGRGARRDVHMKAAEQAVRRLEKEQHPWASAHASALRAGLRRARSEGSPTDYASAAAAFNALGLGLFAAACSARAGESASATGIADLARHRDWLAP